METKRNVIFSSRPLWNAHYTPLHYQMSTLILLRHQSYRIRPSYMTSCSHNHLFETLSPTRHGSYLALTPPFGKQKYMYLCESEVILLYIVSSCLRLHSKNLSQNVRTVSKHSHSVKYYDWSLQQENDTSQVMLPPRPLLHNSPSTVLVRIFFLIIPCPL